MALNTVGDLITEVLVRNHRSTTDGFISDTMLQRWTRQAHKSATAYHKWPFTEGRMSTTFAAVEEWYFEGYKADSLRIVTIGGSRLQKTDFANYQIFREKEPSGSDRVFSDFGGLVYINPSINLSGTLTVYGQYEPLLDSTDYTALTVFSGHDEEGNEAIVEMMSSYLKEREHEMTESDAHKKKGFELLEALWKRILDEQYAYQTHPDSGGMFKRIDVLRGGVSDEPLLKENQF